jgi:hypothetical protein
MVALSIALVIVIPIAVTVTVMTTATAPPTEAIQTTMATTAANTPVLTDSGKLCPPQYRPVNLVK